MIRPTILFGAIALAVGVTGDLRLFDTQASERTAFSDTCRYYQTRAKSARRVRPGEFVVFLADACVAAEFALDNGTLSQRNRSALLLSRIVMLHDTIDKMNAERTISMAARVASILSTNMANGITVSDASPRRVGMANPVTPTGEFLIAHRLGVMLAYDAWLDSGVTFSLGSDR